MSNQNLPAGCTDQDTDGGIVKQPTDEQVHAHVCENWRDLMDNAAFESAEVDGCYDESDEKTDVLITVRVLVGWVNVQ